MIERGIDILKRKIIKTVQTLKNLNVEILNKLSIGAEIQDFTEPNLDELEKQDIVKIYKKELKDLRAIKALHGPFLDLKPASPDKLIREVSFNRYLETLNIAYELNMDYVIFHSQINPYLNHPHIEKLNNEQNRDMWIELVEKSKYDGTILIENIFEENPKMLKNKIETINISNIKINLDIGHVKIGKASLEEWIRELKDHIVYMHIHSNDGKYDGHKAPSEYEIKNLYYLLDKYNINPVLSLEHEIDDLEEEIKKYRSE